MYPLVAYNCPLKICYFKYLIKKSRTRETKNLSTDAESRTGIIFEKLHDLSKENKNKKITGTVDVFTRPRVHATAPRVGD